MQVKWIKNKYVMITAVCISLVAIGWGFWQLLFAGHFSTQRANEPYNRLNLMQNYQLDLDPQVDILVDAMRKVETTPLNSVPSAEFYTRSEIENFSETSLAKKRRRLTEPDMDGFVWYLEGQQELLYRNDQPFTGWYGQQESDWFYYKEGQRQVNQKIPRDEGNGYVTVATFVQSFMPRYQPYYTYLKPQYETMQFVNRDRKRYSILNRGRDGLVLSNLPGHRNSYFLKNTKEYHDIPMEVVEEATVGGQTWLHVFIGYTDLGWILKDSTYQDYVLTNYSERRLLDTVQRIMREEVDSIEGMVGASFIDNETMAQVDVDNQIFFPASTQKIYVLAELYRQYKEGILSPDTLAVMEESNMVAGAGHINEQPEGTEFSLDTLVDMVGIYSDNTAANMLIDAVGGGAIITKHTHELGMLDTYVEGKYYYRDNGLFQTTPHDAALLFAKLHNNQVNGDPWDEMLINKFRLNTHTFLRTYLWETNSWNKSGLGEPEQNDVATFVTRYGSYSIAVYTNSWANYDARFDEVGRLSARVYDAFNEIRADLWHPYDPALGFYQD